MFTGDKETIVFTFCKKHEVVKRTDDSQVMLEDKIKMIKTVDYGESFQQHTNASLQVSCGYNNAAFNVSGCRLNAQKFLK